MAETLVEQGLRLHFLLTAGITPAPERQVVERTLPLAKLCPTKSEKTAIAARAAYIVDIATTTSADDAFKRKLAQFWGSNPQMQGAAEAWWESIADERTWFREALTAVAADRRAAGAAYWPDLDQRRRELLIIPKYRRRGDSLQLEHLFIPTTTAAMVGLALDLLLTRDFGDKLRQCRLDECRAFFVAGVGAKKFCSTACQRRFDNIDAVRRKREQRARDARAISRARRQK